MNNYRSNAALKALARKHLLTNYTSAIGALIMIQLATGAISVMANTVFDRTTPFGAIGFILVELLTFVLVSLFASGQAYLYLNYCCGNRMRSNDVFYGFKAQPEKAILMNLLVRGIVLIAFLPGIGSLVYYITSESKAHKNLLIGIVLLLAGLVFYVYFTLHFALMFYLLHDFPEYTWKETLLKSKKLMEGNKTRLFLLQLSFIPLMLVSLITFGIGNLWVEPYMNATQCEFFLDLIKNKGVQD